METKKFFSTTFILLAAVPSVVSGGVRVKGPLGGNVSVHCSYPKENENVEKYFNKGKPETQLVRLEGTEMWLQDSRFSLKDDEENRNYQEPECGGCWALLVRGEENDWKLEGRLTLFDNKEKNVFVVNIGNLSVQDAGRYGCGVETTGQDLITVVHLTVMKAVPSVVSGGVRVKGPLGGNVSVHCSYPKENENVEKYFNKGKPETQLVRLEGTEMWLQDSRFSLKDDEENRNYQEPECGGCWALLVRGEEVGQGYSDRG
ncbi:hypothetical protein KOW79_020996 [Hemibagrus wyckioides]|uniref:Ig-like domain-containing protein n=1 Tax=Hemibagrus wyckioides TaxID=337641 RepID=A0A9D3SA67_9TELE|nr:hypothetical protein KOW79_020996 [Hemibagrus wyckioides]